MPRSESKIRTLVLGLIYPHRAAYFDDWADSLCHSEYFSAELCNIAGLSPRRLARQLPDFELVVLLHSCVGDTTRELARLSHVLGERNGAHLVAFVGNEYNSPHAPIAEKRKVLEGCRPDIIATQLLREAGEFLYQDIASHVISLPHALNPDAYRPGPADPARSRDVGVRNFRYSPLLGDQDRNRIIDYFQTRGAAHGLSVDIDFKRRFGRKEWAGFLAASRGTVSSEAGSWYLERDDALMRKIYTHVCSARSGLVISDNTPLRSLVRRLPLSVKGVLGSVLRHGPVKYAAFEDSELDFEELHELFFRHARPCPVYSKAVSSRHFDAVGAKTCQVLLYGRYNDILVANEHYLEVASDLSNTEEVIARFKDADERRRITETAYDYVMAGHTYAHRATALREAVEQI